MDIRLYFGIIVFLVGIALGLPISWTFLSSSIVILSLLNKSFSFMPGTYYHALNSYVLMAIAFFVFAGNLMSSSGISEKIVNLSHAIVGKVKGGMVVVAVVAALFLSALTGSTVPVVAALVPLLAIPMEKYGYDRKYVTSVICCSSFLGYLIPPSVPVLLYCLMANQSVAAVFLSTIIPGLLVAVGYIIVNYFICDKYLFPTKEVFKELSKKEKIKSFLDAIPALGCPIIVLVGIYGGIFTPNEAGAVAVLYTIIIGIWFYKKLDKNNLLLSMQTTLTTLGMTFTLLAAGTVFARVLAREDVPQLLAYSIINLFENKTMILIMLNILFLILGMFIDGIPILAIVVPLVLPLATGIDVNLVHLGAIIVLNIGIGVITPPFAVALFVGSRLSKVPFADLARISFAFLLFVAIPVLLLTTFIPALSCWLPTMVLGSNVVGLW